MTPSPLTIARPRDADEWVRLEERAWRREPQPEHCTRRASAWRHVVRSDIEWTHATPDQIQDRQAQILSLLEDADEMSTEAIRRALEIGIATLQGTLGRMHKLGLIEARIVRHGIISRRIWRAVD